ncbi:hypothetical protein D6D06_07816 [Aureobasidium pullulans]|nr:hypothetical protein D6D06_07816 [Aureobasidium pullulans]
MADESPTINSRRHRRNQSTPQTSIPLQDLGPAQHAPINQEPPSPSAQASHRRTLSDRGRSLFRRNRDSLLSRSPGRNPPPPNTRAYSPISEDPPSPPQIDRNLSPLAYVTSPTGHRTRVEEDHDEDVRTPLSPQEGSNFQQAMGFAGLSIGAPARPSLNSGHGRLGSVPSLRTVDTSPYDEEPDDPTGFFPHEDDMDTVPLTDISRLDAHSPQRNDRGSFQSIRFLSPSVSHTNNADVESGNLTPSGRWSRSPDGHSRSPADSRRSLSPMGDSPFHRASDMMRKMSMRVVNLSNEPEVAERMIRRKSSVGRSPGIPEAPDFAGDGAPRSPVSEKMPSPMLRPSDRLESHAREQNPFRGKSLGIFPPNSKLRLKLADFLLHPVTEPFILVLIVFQTILLAVEARNNVNDEPRSKRFGTTWIDIALLVLFVIYTIEIMIRVIVSGFVVNPIEYSTIDRKVGLRTAVLRKANDIYDNIFQSLEMVFVVMSSNTFSDQLYYLADSDYLSAGLFFAAGIIIFPLWLVNLLIAVITSSFQVIRDESKASAFTAQEQVKHLEAEEGSDGFKQKSSTLKQFVGNTRWIWIAVITYGLIVQCLRSAYMSPSRAAFLSSSELGVTIALDCEIILRFVADWRHFHKSKRNLVDLGLAIITTVIQIPVIKHSGQPYAWLTVFQIIRIYRVVLAVEMTRTLILTVLGDFTGFANLIMFVMLLCFLAAIFATQIFRGQIPQENDDGDAIRVPFFDIYNAFLGMYQIFSSENWTDIMYDVTSYNVLYNNGWIGAAFCIMWFILANFIVLNMFIAVIQENFDVSEDEKRLQQVKAFLAKRQVNASSGSQGTLSLSTIFKFGQVRRQDPLDYGSAQTEMLLKDAVVRDFLDDHEIDPEASPPDTSDGIPTNGAPVKSGTLAQRWEQLLNRLFNREPNPFYSNVELQKAHEEVDTRQMVKEVVAANERVKRAQREYLRKYPNYNVSLFIFRINNPIRRWCQRIVGPGRGGDRIEGVAPSRPIWYAFSAFIYAAIVAMVLLACVTTPLYQKQYFTAHGFKATNWFVFSDMGFAALFTIESVIRVIADGFYWTPNAYYRSSWGIIDGIVLVTLWTDILTTIYNPGGGSRAVGAFKALRALRLLNVSDNARDTFHSVIVMGGWKVVSAAFVSMSLLVPFAIYGLNIFNGRFMECNDGNGITNLTDCTGEYLSQPFDWDVLAPRQVANPWYDFDNFGSSLFILFQIVSQEGWIDVMWSGQSITGVFTQPDAFASQGNAVFFVAFNLLGAVFVLTLFVSVFMRNYTEQTGVAFLTTEQRSWLELRKLLRQISPSKRPSSKEVRETWKEWCYRRAVTKNGRWQRSVTAVLVFHLLLLCLEWYPDNNRWDRARDYIFLVLTFFYIVNIIIRIIGLSWTRFRKSAWDVYSIFSVSGTFVTLILLLTNFKNRDYVQVHKLFLVSIALLLIPRNNQLDQLFKTAAASLTSIANLLATWFVLFLVFAIAFTQTFGLTRFGEGETDNQNFRTVPKALVMLFRMSSGEGWNEVMMDFTTVTPPYCTIGEHYYDGDCGSDGWAMALFISWNILSMYVFMNLFISLIYESFSYVYQRSSGLSVISREEIRRFKQAWAEFDPSGSGYISKEKFPRLLGELSGVFEMRIYDGDFTVSNIIADCTSHPHRAHPLGLDGPKDSPQIDLDKLNERLSEIPIVEIQRRRRRMNIFYEEVLVSADPDRGVEFNSLLMILAHYKVINDNKSLRLEEFLRRRARLQRVEEAVRRNVVVGFFDTLYWARRFRKSLEAKKNARMTMVPQLDVPEIFIQDDSEDVTNAGRKTPSAPSTPIDHQTPSWTTGSDNGTPSFNIGPSATRPMLRNRSDSIQVSPSASPTRSRAVSHSSPSEMRDIPEDWHFAEALIEGHNRSRSPSPSPQHLDPDATSDAYGGLGVGAGPRSRAQTLSAAAPEPRSRAGTLSVAGAPAAGGRSRAGSSVNAQNVLDVLDTSAWGESIRRSFTTRGSTVGPRGSASRDASAEPMPPIPDTRPSSSSQAEGNGYDHPHER